MKFLIQRVKEAKITIDNLTIAEIDKGLLVYCGLQKGDTTADADLLIDRVKGIRIFEDENGKLNLSSSQVGAKLLLVSNFTLYGDAFSGRRPSFLNAMGFEEGKKLFDYIISISDNSPHGVFGADMKVYSICDGPINMILESVGGKPKP